MLINALCDYYDILAANGKLVPDGYSQVDIHYLISLTPQGKIDKLINWQDKKTIKDKKKGKFKEIFIPRKAVMPMRTEKTATDSNIVEHRPIYIFGLNFEEGRFTCTDRTQKAQKSHEAFKKVNLAFIEGLDSPVINAYRAFIESWEPEKETENPILLEIGKQYSKSKFAFCLSGRPDLLLHDDSLIKEKWENRYAVGNGDDDEDIIAQCGITGRNEPIARLHNKINGFYSTGSVFVGYKYSSSWSYGNENSYNSNISETAMKKYTTAFNYLMESKNHKNNIDDVTVVYWAADKDDCCSDFITSSVFGFNDMESAEEVDNMLSCLIRSARDGSITYEKIPGLENIDPNVDFYIVGLKPNVSRIAVKFIYHRKFGEMLQNIARYQSEMQIGEETKPVAIWMLQKALLRSPKPQKEGGKNEKVKEADAPLISEIFKAIIYGTNYPYYMLATLVRRAKTDRELSRIRAGAIKACLIRNEKEELTLSLDKNNKNQAYLCGRLFAVLVKIQEDLYDNKESKLNRSIKDTYFSSAASRPSLVFPKLLSLAQNHLKSLGKKEKVYRTPNYYNIIIGEITDGFDGQFPDALTLTEQGTFMIGYYQQYQDFFRGKSAEEESENNIQEDE